MKLKERIYQAATQVNVLSPETSLIVEADTFHFEGKPHCCNVIARKQQLYRGLRQWHGIRWKRCELGRSIELLEGYTETSCEKQGLVDGSMEVGLIDSTLRVGKPSTWGSGQQRCDSVRDGNDTLKSLETT